MGGLHKKLKKATGKNKLQKILPMSPGMKKIDGILGGGGGNRPPPPVGPGAPVQQAGGMMPAAAVQQVPPGATPAGFGQTMVGTTPQDLPPGIDPNAVAADPQGYEQWKMGRQQAMGVAPPGSQGQFDPNSVPGTGPTQPMGLSPELQGSTQQVPQGPMVPGGPGTGGPSAEAQSMMQSMAQAAALRKQQPLPSVSYTDAGQGA